MVVLFGSIVGLGANAVAPWGIAWVAEPRILAAASDSMIVHGGAMPGETPGRRTAEPLSITLAQAKALFDLGAAVFVDARPPYEYGEAHIPHAINIPWEEIEYYRDEIGRLPRDSTIVIYCAGESCDLSVHLGDYLAERSFTRVRVSFGGWLEWVSAGYPVETH